MTNIDFKQEDDRRIYADWHLDLLDRLFGGEIELHHELYFLTHAHRRQHNGGKDDGSCVAWPSPPARAAIWSLIVNITGARRFLEIGTALGYSTALMADAAGPEGCIDTIEIDPEHAEEAARQLDRLGLANRVRIIRGDAAAILPNLVKPYDVILADGGGEEISGQIKRLTRPGGPTPDAIASMRDQLIEELANLKAKLGGKCDADELALSKSRAAYSRIVSVSLETSRA